MGGAALAVDDRSAERRATAARRLRDDPSWDGVDRRRIHSADGRRIADRRTPLIPAPRLELPRAARRHADQIEFVERLEPTPRDVLDIESARLVTVFQGGDCYAFNELYRLHFDRLYRYLTVVLSDAHEAEDAAQRTFLSAFQALRRFEVRPGGSVSGWLTSIARNEALGHQRKHARVQLQDVAMLARHREQAGGTHEPHDTGDTLDGELVALLKRLPDAQRQAIVLRYVVGLDTDEIALTMGRTPIAVRKLEHRGLRFLEKRLAATGRVPAGFAPSSMLMRLRRAPVLAARRWALASVSYRPALASVSPRPALASVSRPTALAGLSRPRL